jgi:hypothetical protein
MALSRQVGQTAVSRAHCAIYQSILPDKYLEDGVLVMLISSNTIESFKSDSRIAWVITREIGLWSVGEWGT